MDKLYSTAEAARYLGITTGRVRQLRLAGILEGVQQIGRADWFFTLATLKNSKGRKTGRPKSA